MDKINNLLDILTTLETIQFHVEPHEDLDNKLTAVKGACLDKLLDLINSNQFGVV